MIIINNEEICRSLWKKLNLGSLSFGVTGSFEFRKFYSSLFGMKPYFVCDNVQNPSLVLPLCEGAGRLDWFGTNELEDTPIYCDRKVNDQLIIPSLNLSLPTEMTKVNALQLKKMQECRLVQSSEISGTKVVVETKTSLIGHAHWSERNLYRTRKIFSNLGPNWVFHENPDILEINSVFAESVKMFSTRKRSSKLQDASRRKKYQKIFSSSVPGVRTILGTCFIDDVPTIRVLILLCENIATVSTITVNPEHPKGKIILQHGFRYAILSLPDELRLVYNCRAVDYQGGDYSWKREVSLGSQLAQFNVKLNYGHF